MRLTTASIAPRTRLPAIDELKGIAIILIIVYHAISAFVDIGPWRLDSGVDIFLMVSGFALSVSSAAVPIGAFMKRRFFRIFPAYWIALALFAALGAGYYGAPGWGSLLVHALGLQAFGPLYLFSQINESFWFISLAILMYAAFLAVRRRIDDLPFLAIAAGALTLATAAIYAWTGHDGGLRMLAPRVPDFFIGAIAGRIALRGGADMRPDPRWAIGLALIVIAGCAGASYATIAIGGAIVLAWLAARPSIIASGIGARSSSFLARAGLISYELFLFHEPLMRGIDFGIVRRLVAPRDAATWELIAAMALGLGVAIAISAAVHAALGKLVYRYRNKDARSA